MAQINRWRQNPHDAEFVTHSAHFDRVKESPWEFILFWNRNEGSKENALTLTVECIYFCNLLVTRKMADVTDSNNNNESCSSEDPENEALLLRKGLPSFKVCSNW